MGREGTGSHRHGGEDHGVDVHGDRAFRHPGTQPFGERAQLAQVHVGRQKRELLATVAGKDVAWSGRCAQPGADLGQDPVTRGMTMLIIDRLEVVDINDDQAQRTSATTHPGDLHGHRRLQETTGVETGQRIDHRQPALVGDEHRHSSDRQQEHQCARHGHDRNVMRDPTGIFDHHRDRCSQRGRQQRGQPNTPEVLLRRGRGYGQPDHRRMKCRRTQGHVGGKPHPIQEVSRPVGTSELLQSVDGVRNGDQAKIAHKQEACRRPAAGPEKQPQSDREQGNIHYWISDQGRSLDQPAGSTANIGPDQVQPRQHESGDGQRTGLQQAGQVTPGSAIANEKDETGQCQRVAGQTENDGKDGDVHDTNDVSQVDSDNLVGRKNGCSSDHVHNLAGGQQQPGQPRCGPEPADADEHRHRRTDADQKVAHNAHRTSATMWRHQMVTDNQTEPEYQVKQP